MTEELIARANARIRELEAKLALQPLDTAPQDGSVFYVQQQAACRWLSYRPGSEQLRKGIKGRWQQHTGYGFENCELSGDGWKPLPPPEAA